MVMMRLSFHLKYIILDHFSTVLLMLYVIYRVIQACFSDVKKPANCCPCDSEVGGQGISNCHGTLQWGPNKTEIILEMQII